MPSNFRTYEAQSRLLAAVLASSPGLKLNFKAIALHFGSDVTAWSIEHRFRPIKKQVAAVRAAVADGRDAKDLAGLVHMSDKDIAKYYGESTPQGIEFQFRSIRKDAKALRDAVDKGESPLTARRTAGSSSSSSSGPGRKRKAAAAAASGGDEAAPALRRAPAAKRARAPRAEVVLSNEDDTTTNGGGDSEEVDYDRLDPTPVGTPTRPSAASDGFGGGGGTITPASASFVPDATPALTVGTTPPGSREPEALLLYGGGSNRYDDDDNDDDDDDDDDVYIIDTPSKAPKTGSAQAQAHAQAHHPPAHAQPRSPEPAYASFEAADDAWRQPYFLADEHLCFDEDDEGV